MIWILYDTDYKRAAEFAIFLMRRYGIDALPYQDVVHYLENTEASATFLVHCDAVKKEFNRIAKIRVSGQHKLRFYCTDLKDKTQQVAYIPEEVEKLVSGTISLRERCAAGTRAAINRKGKQNIRKRRTILSFILL